MPIKIDCPNCLTSHTLLDSLEGKKVRCKSCKQPFLVQTGAPSAPGSGGSPQKPIVAMPPPERQGVANGAPPAPPLAALEPIIAHPDPRPGPPGPPAPYPARSRDPMERRGPLPPGPGRGRYEEEHEEDQEGAGSSKLGLWIAICVGVLLLVGGGVTALILMNKGGSEEKQEQVAQGQPKNPAQPAQPANPGNQFNQPPNQAGANVPGKPTLPVERPVEPVNKAAPAPEISLWKVEADPPKEEVKIPADLKLAVILPGDGVLYPTGISKYVLLGRNLLPKDKRVLWDLEKNSQAAVLQGAIGREEPFALSPDGLFLALPASGQKNTVDIWSLEKAQLVRRLPVSQNLAGVEFADFAGPGQLVTIHAGDAGKIIQVWDLKTGEEVKKIDGPSSVDPKAAALSPGRRYLALGVGKAVKVYDLKEGTLAGEKGIPDSQENFFLSCKGLAFGPDGKDLTALYTGASKSRLVSWDVPKGDVAGDYAFAKELIPLGYRGAPLEATPDGAAWLAGGQYVIGRKDGRVLSMLVLANGDFHHYPHRALDKDHILAVVQTQTLQRTQVLVNFEMGAVPKALLPQGGNLPQGGRRPRVPRRGRNP